MTCQPWPLMQRAGPWALACRRREHWRSWEGSAAPAGHRQRRACAPATSGRVSAMLMVATAVEERLMIVGHRRAWAPPTARGAQQAGAENAPALPQRPARIRAMAGRCILAVQSETSPVLFQSLETTHQIFNDRRICHLAVALYFNCPSNRPG